MPSWQQKVSWNKTWWLSKSKRLSEDTNWWQTQIIIFSPIYQFILLVEYIYKFTTPEGLKRIIKTVKNHSESQNLFLNAKKTKLLKQAKKWDPQI